MSIKLSISGMNFNVLLKGWMVILILWSSLLFTFNGIAKWCFFDIYFAKYISPWCCCPQNPKYLAWFKWTRYIIMEILFVLLLRDERASCWNLFAMTYLADIDGYSIYFSFSIHFICFCSVICSSWWRMLFVMLGNMSFYNTNMMFYFLHFLYILPVNR